MQLCVVGNTKPLSASCSRYKMECDYQEQLRNKLEHLNKVNKTKRKKHNTKRMYKRLLGILKYTYIAQLSILLLPPPYIFSVAVGGGLERTVVSAGMPRHPFPQSVPTSLPGRSQSIPRPAEWHSHLNASCFILGASDQNISWGRGYKGHLSLSSLPGIKPRVSQQISSTHRSRKHGPLGLDILSLQRSDQSFTFTLLVGD